MIIIRTPLMDLNTIIALRGNATMVCVWEEKERNSRSNRLGIESSKNQNFINRKTYFSAGIAAIKKGQR